MEKQIYIYRNPKTILQLSSIKVPVLAYLFQFLSTHECYECRKVNITLYNAFYYLYGNWAIELSQITKKYNLAISYNQIDMNRKQAVQKERTYPIKDNKGLFVLLREKTERIYALFNSIKFAWSDNPQYWNKTYYPDSILGGPSYTLISVCWIDPKLSVYHITPNNYNLHIRHGLKGLRKEELKVTVLIDSLKIFQQDYPTNQMLNNYQKEVKATWTDINNIHNINLIDDFLFKINKSHFKPNTSKEYEIRVEFMHNTNWWKSGWVIDAFYLEEDKE